MATPTYAGKAQQPMGIASWFGSWLGTTPTYAGAGQPVSKASMFGAAAIAYKPAPVPAPVPAPASTDASVPQDAQSRMPTRFALVIPREVLREVSDPDQ